MGYEPKTWVSGETIYAVDLNHMELGIEAASKVGTERQVLGFVDGKQEPITLGVIQLTDIGGFPSFPNGVLTSTGMSSATQTGFLSFIKFSTTAESGAFPIYGTNGVLKVANGVAVGDAVNKGQLDAINLSTLSLPAATTLPVIAPDTAIANSDKLTDMVAKLYATSQAYENKVFNANGGTTTLTANSRGKLIISLASTATSDFVLKLNASLISNAGLFIVCSNMSPTYNIIIESATGQNSVMTDAGNVPEATVTVIPQVSQHFMCNGVYIIGC